MFVEKYKKEETGGVVYTWIYMSSEKIKIKSLLPLS